MPKLFSVGQVARRLHLSEDKVRSLADEAEIAVQRTPGGHRRFTEVAIATYESRPDSPSRKKKKAQSVRRTPVRRASTAVYSTPLDEDEDLLDGPEEYDELAEDDVPPRPVVAPVPPARLSAIQIPSLRDRNQEEEEKRQRSVAVEASRLRDLKAYGAMAIPYDVPVTVRAQIVGDLETYVTSERLPAWVSAWEQKRLVQGRVDTTVEAHRKQVQEEAEQARAEETRKEAAARASRAAQEASAHAKAEAQRRPQELISHGQRYAEDGIMEFDPSDRWKVRSAIEKALREEVASDWDERGVEALVEEVLDEETEDDEDLG